MFVRQIRRRHTPNIVVQIVESYRNEHRQPRQRLIRSMGSAPEGPALEELLRVAEYEKVRLLEQRQPALFPPQYLAEQAVSARREREALGPIPIADARKLQGEKDLKLGFHEVFGQLYDDLGLARLWPQNQRGSERVFRQLVLARLAAPGKSKRHHAAELSEQGVNLPLERIYRMMDRLNRQRQRRLLKHLDGTVRGLLGGPVEVVFLDTTTLSFATEVEDDLRRKGYSKDGKPYRSQVVLALMQTTEGLPVGYRLFPGNTTEVKTLLPMLKELREQFEVGRAVVVADAGLLSDKNLRALTKAGLDWVVAARLRQLKRADFAALGSPQEWAPQPPDGKGRLRRLTERQVNDRRLVVRYCPSRARRDARAREQAVKKAEEKIAKGEPLGRRPGRFLKVSRHAVTLNRKAIERDQLFDGLHGVWTSLSQPPASQIRAHYAELWRIEQGFRVLKHTLRVRPVFHWTERRVRAHVALCYVAFALLRILRWKYARQHAGQPLLSEDRILAELGNVTVSLIRDQGNGNRYLVPFGSTREQRLLYKTVGLTLRRTTTLLSSPSCPQS